jgi:cob(I)alamin adenosyltransferase
MVRLNRIYTKTGDDGTTGLGDGSRLVKHHLRIAAYGTVDELSSVIGLITSHGIEEPHAGHLQAIQNDLFDLGGDLCMPQKSDSGLSVTALYTEKLEQIIDSVNEDLEPLKSFVLPGGKPVAAWLHLARTVCRRAERLVSELSVTDCAQAPDDATPATLEPVNPEVLRYLNRLSDLLFVLSRAVNDGGKLDVLWKPGDRQS